MKKLLAVLVVVLLLGGGGYAWWYYQQNQSTELPETVADAANTVPSEPLPAPAQATELATAGARVMLPGGWVVDEDAPEARVVPGGQAVALRSGAGQLPLLVIGRLTPQTLQSVEPKSYPAAFIKQLGQRLASLQPTPTVSHAGDLQAPPKLLVEAQELVAQGTFPELGNQAARGRFIAGTSAAGEVYLIHSFVAAGSPAEAEVDQIIASLEALPAAAPVAPAAAPAAPAAPAESQTAPAPAAPAPSGGSGHGPAPTAPVAPPAASTPPASAGHAPAGEPTNESLAPAPAPAPSASAPVPAPIPAPRAGAPAPGPAPRAVAPTAPAPRPGGAPPTSPAPTAPAAPAAPH